MPDGTHMQDRRLPPCRLVPDLAARDSGRALHLLADAAEWRDLMQPVVRLKQRLDRVLNSRAWTQGHVTSDDKVWAQSLGLDRTPSGTGVGTRSFSTWLVGNFHLREPGWHLTLVPSWSTIGWNRYRHRAVDREDAQKRRDALDVATDSGEDGTASWRKPLPLVICGEGKHRAEMHQEFFADMLVNLEVDPMPPAQELRIRPVLGACNLIALEWRPPEGPLQTCLLPFPEVSQPLLQAYGVRVSRLPWVPLPWNPLIQRVRSEACCGDEQVPSSIELCLQPARLRRYMIMGGYR